MIKIREEINADLNKINIPTEYETELNRYELPCGVCGRLMYVDRETIESYERGLDYDLDNQFICYDCEQEYQNAAYE